MNGRRFQVQSNLLSFLRLARRLRIRHWLWIDAISIAQHDAAEKAHQVQQMGAIYRSAKHVLIYPGPISRKVKVAAALGWDCNVTMGDMVRFNFQRCKYECSKAWTKLVFHHFEAELDEMTRSLYWDRTWIVQEIVLAKECFLVSPAGLIKWKKLCGLWFTEIDEKLLDNGPFGKILLTRAQSMRDELSETPGALDAQGLLRYDDLLYFFGSTKCLDRRDRIYAFLGLSDEVQDLVVDYTKSCSTLFLDVFERVFPKHNGPFDMNLVENLQKALEVSLNCLCQPCALQSSISIDIDAPYIPRGRVVALLHTNAARPGIFDNVCNVLQCNKCAVYIHEAYRDDVTPRLPGKSAEISFIRRSPKSALCISYTETTDSRSAYEFNEYGFKGGPNIRRQLSELGRPLRGTRSESSESSCTSAAARNVLRLNLIDIQQWLLSKY